MHSSQVWKEMFTEKEGQCVYDLLFLPPDGEVLLVAVGSKVHIYSAKDGKVLQSLRGHKDAVYCLSSSRDGGSVVSGGADKQVIIWEGQPYEGKLKYPHSDSIQKVAYSPVALQVLSCSASDIGLWTPEQKSVVKSKVSSRCCDCSWTNDGQYFAIGHYNGTITIWTKNGDEKVKIERPGDFPVWSVKWNPIREDQYDILSVCDWGQKLSFYQLNGKQVGRDRNINYDPTSMKYFTSGEFSIITGTNKKASMYSYEGIFLGVVCEMESWTWSCSVRPGKTVNQVAVGSVDGSLAVYQLTFSTVHGMYQEKYAYRDRMTGVIVEELLTKHTTRIMCHNLVKKVAIYTNLLAVQLQDVIHVFELSDEFNGELKYVSKSKFVYKAECNLLVVCSCNIVLCNDKNLLCLTLQGEKEREWSLDAQIRFIKVVGGPSGKESILVGLRNGHVFRIFLNNPFPNFILKQQVSIRCLDLSLSRSKLAVVDENSIVMVYDMRTRKLLYQEPNATSVAWNQQYEDMLCFSGGGYLNIKASNFPVDQLRQPGFVVGFSGSKIFCLNLLTMIQVDAPQSVPMIQFLERKNFREAYKIACLGVTDGDWKTLATKALEGMDLEIAKKAFVHVREMKFMDLIHNIEERKLLGEANTEVFLADILAYQGKFHAAAEEYKKCGAVKKAVEMFTELREFELAKKFMMSTNQDTRELIAMQADWAMNSNDPQAACNMYMAAGNHQRAVEIMGEHGWVDRLTSVFHQLPKSETEVLKLCAEFFKKLGQPLIAAEVYEKLGDECATISVYIDLKQWDMAFQLAKKYDNYQNDVYRPYAIWLMEHDRFDEAQEAMCKAGQDQEALHTIEQLAFNAIKERRFDDTSYYYWLLAKSSLDYAYKLSKDEAEDDSGSVYRKHLVDKFYHSLDLAECYHVFHAIYCFMEQPFTSYMPEALFNMARYLTLKTLKACPRGISKVFLLYTLAKKSRQLGAYKLARYAYDKLKVLRIPPTLQDAVELGNLTIHSKPYQDKDDLLSMCYRCSHSNPLINSIGNVCMNCRQPYELSFVSFEALPVVEFMLEEGISDEEAVKLINKGSVMKKQGIESVQGNVQSLRPDDEVKGESMKDPFSISMYDVSDTFVPVTCGRAHLEAMHRMEVFIKRWSAPIGNQYFKSIMPDVNIKLCSGCNKELEKGAIVQVIGIRASLLDLQQLNDFTDIVADAKFHNVLPGVFCSEMDRRNELFKLSISLECQYTMLQFGIGIRSIEMFHADDYELQVLLKGHCPFCRKDVSPSS